MKTPFTSKSHHKKTRRLGLTVHPVRSISGFSILELLVSVVIIGIALAGISELLWANTTWLTFLQNKYDTFFAAKRFLNEFKSDMRRTAILDLTLSDSKNLYIKKATEDQFDGYGFLTATTDYYYGIEADTEPGRENQFLIKAGPNKLTAHTVLSGVVGPLGINDTQPKIFQFLDRKSAISDLPTEDTIMIIVNLELLRNEYGKTLRDSPQKSGLALRDEIFLRSKVIHAQ